jgi:non-ribosomal peptide synthetase component E (peptide arylation enzyme)
MNDFSQPERQFETLLDLLDYRLLCQPYQTAFIFLESSEGEQFSLTYFELVNKAHMVAIHLHSQGIKPGERALLLYPSSLEFITAFFGCLYAGIVALENTLCSSSLVSLHLACQSIRQGECAIAGGVNLQLSPDYYVGMSRMKVHSPTGQCYAFDDRADGIVLGEETEQQVN